MNTFFTFDFFDTIFFRKHGTFESFLYSLGNYLIENNFIDFDHPQKFVQERLLKEKEASFYFRNTSETLAPDLRQIYDFPSSSGELNREYAEYEKIEFEFEKKYGIIPFFMSKYIQYLLEEKHSVAIISNSYYSADQIIDLLLNCSSLSKTLISRISIYTSSDKKTNKQKNLFDLVRQDLIKKHGDLNFIHTGDSYELDVIKPKKHGYYTIHSIIDSFPKVKDLLTQKKLITPEVSKLLSSRYIMRELPLHLHRKLEFATISFTPAIYAFCGFIRGNSILNSKLFFLEREGYQLKKLYEEYCMISNYSVLCESLPVSRYALSPIIILSNNEKIIEESARRISQKTGFSHNATLSFFREKVGSVLEFIDKNFEDGKNYTLIDFGYKGTISYLVDIALRHLKKKCVIRTLLVFNDSNSEYPIDIRALFDQKVLKTSVIGSAGGAIGLFEELLMPDFGSTLGYEKSKPIRDDYLINEEQKKEKLIIIDHIKKLIKILALYEYQVKNNEIISLNEILLSSFSNTDLIYSFSNWNHEVNLGTDSIIPLFPSIKDIEGLLISEKKIRELPASKHLIRNEIKYYRIYTYSGQFTLTANNQCQSLTVKGKYYFAKIKPIALIDLDFNFQKLNKVSKVLLNCPVNFSNRINKIELFIKKISNGSKFQKNYRCELEASDRIEYPDFSINLGSNSISINLYSSEFIIFECVIF